MATVPSLDRLDPEQFKALPRQQQEALYLRVATLEAQLRAILLTGPSLQGLTPGGAVGIDEACSILAMSKDFAYRHWGTLGGYRDDDGRIKFSRAALEQHITQGPRGHRD